MRIFSITTLFVVGFISVLSAQNFKEPVKYIEFFSKEFVTMQDLQIEYSSFLVHTRSDVAEKKRQNLLKATKTIHDKFAGVEAYADDKGIKSNAVKVLDIMLEIGNKDYAKLSSEKSGCGDCFATVLTESEMTDKDSKGLGKQMNALVKSIDDFAKANDIKMEDSGENHETLLGKINRINGYLRDLDLATLEVQYASNDIIDALNANKIDDAKTAVKNMSKATANASKRLKKVERIPEDATAISQAQKLVDFHKNGVKGIYADMLSAFDKKGQIINSKVKSFNKAIERMNQGVNTWNGKYQVAKHNLQQRHIPKPKQEFKRS